MDTAIYVIMLLVCFGFLLKQTFQNTLPLLTVTAVCSIFAGIMWPAAIGQSRTQIASWLSNPGLMRDTSVLLCIDIAMYLWYCFMSVNLANGGRRHKAAIWLYRAIRLYPGVCVFAVIFSALVSLIFAFPGTEFPTTAWCFAAALAMTIPMGAYALRWLLPDKETRLELLFWVEMACMLIGIIVTVNGTTAVEGTDKIDWLPTVCIAAITLLGALIGYLRYNFNENKKIKHL